MAPKSTMPEETTITRAVHLPEEDSPDEAISKVRVGVSKERTSEEAAIRKHIYENRELLTRIYDRIQESSDVVLALTELKNEICGLWDAEAFTVYERTADGREIASRYMSKGDLDHIALPLGPGSIAGYVAMSQQALRITDVYDMQELLDIHPRLRFNHTYDQAGEMMSVSMLVIPISFGDTLLGILQVINKNMGDEPFLEGDLGIGQQLAQVLGQRFRTDRETTQGPFEGLIHEGLTTLAQLEEVREDALQRGRSMGYILHKDFEVDKERIGASLEQFYQIPYMSYDPDILLPERMLEDLNRPFLIHNKWVPIANEGDVVTILIDNPNDTARIMDIQRIVHASSYEFMVALEEDILLFLGVQPEDEVQEIAGPQVEMDELLGRLDAESDGVASAETIDGTGELVDENAATVIQLVNRLIADAVAIGASDIHVEPGKRTNPGIVRMRVDGICRRTFELPHTHVRYVVARVKIMSKIDISETRLPQDGKISCRLYGSPLELRVATLPTVNGESVVMRVLAAGEPLPFDKLNLVTRNEVEIVKMMEHPHGLILVVGPTGSGKTTTLHALLGTINTPERKILTAEDPVEITQEGLQQVQIRAGIGFDFARALRSFLRCDPDVILIGEMRDKETAHSGIEASLTGHLVFSTLHTNSAPETVTRLLDMGLDPLNFADALIGVVAQRLVRTLCVKCKESYTPDSHEVEVLINAYGAEYFPELGVSEADLQLCRPAGCEICGNTGYKGRTGIHEVLEATQTIKDLILTRPGAGEVRDMAADQGMRTLLQDGVAKVFNGQCDFKQVRAVTLA
ncbi:MAG: GspE/PulE family protein [Lentisphaeria bacterium]|nr:GspE/PulE family protein [Lentisphaeria bacterium]